MHTFLRSCGKPLWWLALLCGAWNGVLVAGLGLQPIVATLILMVAGRGLAQLLTDGQIVTVLQTETPQA